jgi:hypothetical protein
MPEQTLSAALYAAPNSALRVDPGWVDAMVTFLAGHGLPLRECTYTEFQKRSTRP